MKQYIQVGSLAFARNINGSISIETISRDSTFGNRPSAPVHEVLTTISPEDAAKLKEFFADEN